MLYVAIAVASSDIVRSLPGWKKDEKSILWQHEAISLNEVKTG